MAKKTLNNGDTGAVIRADINDNFTEIYAKLVPATALADGYLKKEDFATFAGKQVALTDPLCLVAAPASATAAGTKGQWAQDGTYIYLCTATNTWVRAAVAFATWGE